MDRLHETLVITQEEAAEVIQAISKCIRFGMDGNKEKLTQEVGDLLCMVDLLITQEIINPMELLKAKEIKVKKLKKWSKVYVNN
jgi:NTP pyrophosphatase (non-canonical NTP hydrolase)